MQMNQSIGIVYTKFCVTNVTPLHHVTPFLETGVLMSLLKDRSFLMT